jgi:hypothetical protein
MMRRIVDATIPALSVVAVVPVVPLIADVPTALRESLGRGLGIIWCVVVGAAMLGICVGILFRKSRPSLAWKMEWPALLVAATFSAVYSVAIFTYAGMRGWVAAWFVLAVGAHCMARYVEMSLARRAAKKADR